MYREHKADIVKLFVYALLGLVAAISLKLYFYIAQYFLFTDNVFMLGIREELAKLLFSIIGFKLLKEQNFLRSSVCVSAAFAGWETYGWGRLLPDHDNFTIWARQVLAMPSHVEFTSIIALVFLLTHRNKCIMTCFTLIATSFAHSILDRYIVNSSLLIIFTFYVGLFFAFITIKKRCIKKFGITRISILFAFPALLWILLLICVISSKIINSTPIFSAVFWECLFTFNLNAAVMISLYFSHIRSLVLTRNSEVQRD